MRGKVGIGFWGTYHFEGFDIRLGFGIRAGIWTNEILIFEIGLGCMDYI